MKNKITVTQLRQIIQEELVKALVEGPDDSAKEDPFKVTSTAASATLGKKIGGASSVSSAAEKVKVGDPESAAKGIADVIASTFPNLKGGDLKAALQKLVTKVNV